MRHVVKKAPQSRRKCALDWAQWLGGDTISSSSWTVPAGVTQTSASFTDTVTQVFLSGGTDGVTYRVTNQIETAGGESHEQTLFLMVRAVR